MLWLNLTIGLIFFVYLGRVMHKKKNSTRDKLNYNIKQQCAGKFARLLIVGANFPSAVYIHTSHSYSLVLN